MQRTIIASAVIVAALAAPTAASASTDLTIIGHRGTESTLLYVENSKDAVKAAMLAGAAGVEVDVRLTSDDKVIAMHDATLDRTTTCTGLVSERTYDDIRTNCQLKITGEKVPNLYELAWTYEKYNAAGDRLWVHTKFEASSAVRSSVMAAVDKYSVRDQTVILADEDDYLDDWSKWSLIERALIFNQSDVNQGGSEAWEGGFDYAVPYATPVTEALVDTARATGSKVYAVEGFPLSLAQAQDLGLDGFIANDVTAAVA